MKASARGLPPIAIETVTHPKQWHARLPSPEMSGFAIKVSFFAIVGSLAGALLGLTHWWFVLVTVGLAMTAYWDVRWREFQRWTYYKCYLEEVARTLEPQVQQVKFPINHLTYLPRQDCWSFWLTIEGAKYLGTWPAAYVLNLARPNQPMIARFTAVVSRVVDSNRTGLAIEAPVAIECYLSGQMILTSLRKDE